MKTFLLIVLLSMSLTVSAATPILQGLNITVHECDNFAPEVHGFCTLEYQGDEYLAIAMHLDDVAPGPGVYDVYNFSEYAGELLCEHPISGIDTPVNPAETQQSLSLLAPDWTLAEHSYIGPSLELIVKEDVYDCRVHWIFQHQAGSVVYPPALINLLRVFRFDFASEPVHQDVDYFVLESTDNVFVIQIR